ncbi:MAG: MgtC/SapB family protein [Planctomycetes bacterium]|nr:MgtC/SapB family protein [Planctomycetota bacterium]
MELLPAFESLGIALGLGLLVGLQREQSGPRVAGIRTFPLIALLGASTGLLAEPLGAWIVATGLAAVGAVVVTVLVGVHRDPQRTGTTTALAMLSMYVVGALAALGPWEIAVALGGTVFVLLQEKVRLHALADRFGAGDLRAVAQLALVALVLLPILPDRDLGPYGVWNPRHLGLVATLVCGIGLGAYVVQRLLGARAGVPLTGLLGGLVSSTATTAGIARRAGAAPAATATAIVLASSLVPVRQAIEIAAVAPDRLGVFAPALAVTFFGLWPAIGLGLWRLARHPAPEIPPSDNPAQLGAALVFAAVFAVVLVAVRFAEDRLGSTGVFAVAAVSGLTDVDAITLSSARLCAAGRLSDDVAWRAVLLASLANLAFKGAIAAALGGRRTGRLVALAFAPVPLAGVACWWLP